MFSETSNARRSMNVCAKERVTLMGTNAGVGMSHHRNPKIAGREAAERALAAAGINRPDFVFMFASVGYEQRALLDAVRAATGGAPLAGKKARSRL
jgi:hypothetical protein